MEEGKNKLLRKGKNTSAYILYKLEELKSLFSKRLGVDINDVYNTDLAIGHAIKLIIYKPIFDLEQIKLDILNNVVLEDIAIYYKEPLKVIEEIKDNINVENYNIVSSKIYILKELEKIFGVRGACSSYKYKILEKINLEDKTKNRSRTGYWLGKDIIDVYDALVIGSSTQKKEMYGKEKLITLREASILLGIKYTNLMERLLKKDKIMGIEVSYKRVEANVYFLKYNEIMAVKNNIKKYIEVKKVMELNKGVTRNQIHLAKTIYKYTIGKPIYLKNRYIKKENAVLLTKILNLITLDMSEYLKEVKKLIENNKTKTFKLTDIQFTMYRVSNYKKQYEKDIEISKKEALLMFDEKINRYRK